MKALLVTGQPSCGKTTLVKRLIELAKAASSLPISGFVTDEVVAGSSRIGFDVVSVSSEARGLLARKGLKSRAKTGAYGVDVASFEKIALPLLAQGEGQPRIVVIDEVGRMEMHSAAFADTVRALLEDDDVLLLGSVAAPRYGHVVPLAEEIKGRSDVCTLHLKASTRAEVMAQAASELHRLLDGREADGETTVQAKRRRTRE